MAFLVDCIWRKLVVNNTEHRNQCGATFNALIWGGCITIFYVRDVIQENRVG